MSLFDKTAPASVEIPNLNHISGTVIKPRNRHDNVISFKHEYPFNFKVVFAIKGLINKNLEYINVSTNIK